MNNRIEITGTVAHVGEVERFASGFTKRTVVLDEQRGQYADCVAFTLTKERAELVTPAMKGSRLTVGGYVKSRSWTNPKTNETKWFTEAEAITVRPADAQAPAETHAPYAYGDAPTPAPAAPTAADTAQAAEVPDDCPF